MAEVAGQCFCVKTQYFNDAQDVPTSETFLVHYQRGLNHTTSDYYILVLYLNSELIFSPQTPLALQKVLGFKLSLRH